MAASPARRRVGGAVSRADECQSGGEHRQRGRHGHEPVMRGVLPEAANLVPRQPDRDGEAGHRTGERCAHRGVWPG